MGEEAPCVLPDWTTGPFTEPRHKNKKPRRERPEVAIVDPEGRLLNCVRVASRWKGAGFAASHHGGRR